MDEKKLLKIDKKLSRKLQINSQKRKRNLLYINKTKLAFKNNQI
jgi:hypothetical protein